MRTVIGRFFRRALTLVRGDRRDRELEEEMRLHVELEAEELTREGIPPAAARREALRRFGGVDRHREAVRVARGTAGAEDWLTDLRYAIRTLRRTPWFTVVAVLTLGLGIGSSTAIFSVVQAVILRPLPYPEPGRIVQVRAAWEGAPVARLSPAEYIDLRGAEVFEHIGVYASGTANVIGDGEPERLRAGFLSYGVLPALGTSPRVGRGFSIEEDEDRAAVAILSHELWVRRFAADPAILERTIDLNGTAYEVLGVLPEGFALPEDLASGEPKDIYLPLGFGPSADLPRGSHFLFGVARLTPGVSPEAATAAVSLAGERMVQDYPDDYPRDMGFRTMAPSLGAEILGPTLPALRLLMGAVAFLLLIACANVANLLLARAEGREQELGLRRALGSGRGRLFRQVLVESVVLGLLGSVLGAALAAGAIQTLLALQPPDIPRLQEVRVDGAALLFAAGLALVTGFAFGLVPALRAAAGDPLSSFRGSRGSVGRGENGRLRHMLIVGQLSAAVILLTGASLVGQTFIDLVRSDPGYRTEGLLTAEITLPTSRYEDAASVAGFFEGLAGRLRALPGVVDAGAVSNLPLATSLGDLNFRIEGRAVAEGDVSPRADWQVVTPGYLGVMDIDHVRGRLLNDGDGIDAPGAVVISRTTAERYWPGQDALGQRFVLGGGAGPGEVTVVGIVEDVAHNDLGGGSSAQMYLSHAQFRFWNTGSPVRTMHVVVQTETDPGGLAPLLRAEVRALDPLLAVASVRTMREIVAASVAEPRFLSSLLGAFAAFALALASVGMYGVISYMVGRRKREFGIRMALGARSASVVGMVLRESIWMIGAGLAIGIGSSLLLSRAATGMLYGIRAVDPATLALVAAVLGGVAVLASLLPARRATRIDPASPLRTE
ncbi:MAG TPA: ABC transporter permease [Longimicrobiaceae bacterium]|nr:ABC transporter permease [Longimicrobiaceae bacterium]